MVLELTIGCGMGSGGSAAPKVGANLALTEAKPLSAAYQQPSLAIDPGNPAHAALAYQDGNRFTTCYLALSSDGGRRWKSEALIGAGGAYPLPQGVSHCQNPRVSYGKRGLLVYVFQDSGFRRQEPLSIHVEILTSSDDGAHFVGPQILDPTADGPNDWYPMAAQDPRQPRLLVAWSRYAQNFNVFPGVAVAAVSPDGGNAFGASVQVEPQSQAGGYVGAPVIAAGRDGRFYISYMPSAPTTPFSNRPGALEVAASGDGGAQFSATSPGTVVVVPCPQTDLACQKSRLRPFNEVQSLAAGWKPRSVYIAWWDDRGPDGLARIVFASSADGGSSWSPARIVAIPSGRAADQQFSPSLSVSPSGRIDLAYYNLRDGRQRDVYWTSSIDGGQHFAPPLRVTSQSSQIDVGPAAGPTGMASFGNFLGLASVNGEALIAWTDARRGTLTTGHQDVFLASVTVNGGAG